MSVGDAKAWSQLARGLVTALEPIALEAFTAAYAEAKTAGEAWRGQHFRARCLACARVMLRVPARQAGLPTPPEWEDPMPAALQERLEDLMQEAPAGLVAVAAENLLARLPEFKGGRWRLRPVHDRKEAGVFFTPPPMAAALVRRALQPRLDGVTLSQLAALRVVDPSMGGGVFLVEAMRRIVARAIELGRSKHQAAQLALACIHGVDQDPGMVEIAQALLWIEAADPKIPLQQLTSQLREGDALWGPSPTQGQASNGAGFDWAHAFPAIFLDSAGQPREGGGFDLVLGNPPWGRIKAELKEFFTWRDPRVRDLQGVALRDHVDADTDAAWLDYRAQRAGYLRALRAGGAFEAQRVELAGGRSTGDDDLYKLFAERSVQLLGPRGRLGLILPAALTQSSGASGLRRLLLDQGTITSFDSHENRERWFPIHGMFRYALLVWQRGSPGGIQAARFRGKTFEDGPGVALSAEWIARVGGERRVVPEVRDARSRDLLERLHKAWPTLESPGGPWSVEFVRELDMTNDRALFSEEAPPGAEGTWIRPDGERMLPLYEGRLIHQFDHAAKAWLGGAGRRARWTPLGLHEKALRPHYRVSQSTLTPHQRVARAGFCDITGHANERTVLAALVPAGLPCGNKVPTLRFSSPDPRLPHLWLAIANSFVIDWMLRRRVSTTLNFFHWKMTPFPRLDPDGAAAHPLWTAAARLSALENSSLAAAHELLQRHGEPAPVLLDQVARSRLRAELDAAVAELFGLKDLDLILMDFPLLDRKQPPLPGERRSTLTRDLVAAAMGRPGAEDRVATAEALGARGYLPSEHGDHRAC